MHILKINETTPNDFLRYQVGTISHRTALRPTYRKELAPSKSEHVHNYILTGHEETGEPVQVFHLLGFGSTLARAEEMARETLFTNPTHNKR